MQFRALPEKEVKKWQSKAEKDKIRYQDEMKHYVPIEDPNAGKKKKKAKKVGPMNASRQKHKFMLILP